MRRDAASDRITRSLRLTVVLGAALLTLIASGWLVGTLLVPHIDGVDSIETTLAAGGHRVIGLMRAVSWLGSGVVLTILGVSLGAVLLARRRFGAVVFVASCALGATAITQGVKLLVERARPSGGQVAAAGSSFPSGHATESIAAYGALAAVLSTLLALGARGRVLVVAAGVALVVAIGYSRLALGVHHPSDVVAGLLLGGTWYAINLALAGHSLDWPARPGRSGASGAPREPAV